MAETSNAAFKVDQNFNHQVTRFPLEGMHIGVTCETCHNGGIFKGVPTACAGCHNGLMAGGKSGSHPSTSNACADCHNNVDFSQVHVDHSKIHNGCLTCHDGNTAEGKNKNHVKSSKNCEDCHLTITWTIPKFNHDMTDQPCQVCHDGLHTSGKPFNHIRSSNDCAQCHRAVAWKIGVFDHTGVVNGCFKCHDGISATGKSGAHLQTSNDCQNCHTTVAWSPAHFDHGDPSVAASLAFGGCITCHDGRRATGRAPTHFAVVMPTANDCQQCHKSFTSWQGAAWDHQYAFDLPTCVNCHNGQRPPAQGKIAHHIPSSNACVDCHVTAVNYVTWAGAAFKHSQSTLLCASCHNGQVVGALTKAAAPPPGHLNTNNSCEDCHVSSDSGGPFRPATFNHLDTKGTCFSCHNGTTSTSNGKLQTKGPTHLQLANAAATNRCEDCHNTSTWTGAVFNHANVGAQRCDSCHDGGHAGILGKTSTHVSYNKGVDCVSCHSYQNNSFIPASFDHKAETGVACETCHNGTVSVGSYGVLTSKGPSHLPVNAGSKCNGCHTSTASWQAVTFSHALVSATCFNCHNGTTKISKGLLTTKIPNHIPSANTCADCHLSFTTWKTVFDHSKIGAARCDSCHNGSAATGKINDKFGPHIPASNECKTCHSNFVSFSPAATGAALHTIPEVSAHTSCVDCHNGAFTTSVGPAISKPAVHIAIPAGNNCDACHKSFTTWKTTFNHSTVTGQACASCHNGTTATDKPAAHIVASTTCENCHKSTTVWLPVAAPFNHGDTGIPAATSCETCHNGVLATGRNAATHIATLNNACVNCHQYLNWTIIKPGFHAYLSLDCFACHDGKHKTATKAITAKGATHFLTSSLCASCHTTTTWTPATVFDHLQASGSCFSCHDGKHAPAIGRSAAHVLSSTDCIGCHTNTIKFSPAKFSHLDATVSAAACVTCHVNKAFGAATALGKVNAPAPGHPKTSDACGNCHTTLAFTPAHIDHTDPAVAAQNCSACHDTGKPNAVARPVTHPPFNAGTQDCKDCHKSFVTWVTNAKPDHTNLTSNCFSCHNGTTALGKNPTHFATTNVCEFCHNTASFKPANKFDHTQAIAVTPCVTCHDGGHAPALGKASFPAHLATSNTCELCHSGYNTWVTARFDHSDAIVAAAKCESCHDGAHTPAIGKNVTHLATSNDCASCHNTLKFAPAKMPFNHSDATVAAKACFTCHDGAHKLAAGTIIVGKTPTHIPSTNVCSDCHNTSTFLGAIFNHTAAAGKTCVSCHNGTIATGRSASHIVIVAPQLCDACHKSYASWIPVSAAAVDHTQVSPTCFNCHNGTIASGKPAAHVKSSNACATCHAVGSQPWTVYHFDHSDAVVMATTCFTCHNGSVKNANPKDAAHLNTSNACENCHVFTAWGPVLPSKFSHADAIGTCAACHDGTHKLGLTGTLLEHKSTTHFITTLDCALCHNTTLWNPMLPYTHQSAAYVLHYFGTNTTTCITCHKQNNQKIAYAQPGLFPNCAACHSTSFKASSHIKYSTPVIMFYTFTELKDCTGACHQYTDQTLSKIKSSPTNPNHRPTSSSWN